ncbi:MAG TPA: DUF1266 domain-containing protein [Kofleriaceae bacterium]|nr:DUF1266 domain-containing protein [Kofleriaceae bacterium]
MTQPGFLVPVVGGAVVALGGGIAAVAVFAGRRKKAALARWTRGAYSLWTGGEDCGTWPQPRASQSLASWYGATGPGRFWEVIGDLTSGQTGNQAWDQVRALDLLRIGRAAAYIDDDACWTEAAKIAASLRRRYRSWDELAAGFEAGMNAWQRGRGVTDPGELGRVQRNLPVLRRQIWPKIRYDAQLAAD